MNPLFIFAGLLCAFVFGFALGTWSTLEWAERDILKQGWTTTRRSRRIVGKLQQKLGNTWL